MISIIAVADFDGMKMLFLSKFYKIFDSLFTSRDSATETGG